MNREMTLNEFLELATAIKGYRPKSLRLGQWAFNLLSDYHPEIASRLNGSEYDPFHDDTKIPAFLRQLLLFVNSDSGDN